MAAGKPGFAFGFYRLAASFPPLWAFYNPLENNMHALDICNLALNMLGIAPIISFDEDNNNARLCARFFPICRDSALRDHSWSFADKACQLVPLDGVESIDEELKVVCAIPGDCIAARYIMYDRPFRMWGRRIMVDAVPATLIYTARIEDTLLFDPLFVECLQYMLATEMAMCNTRDGNLVKFYRQEYERRLLLARSIDSRENRNQYQLSQKRSNFIQARNSGSQGVENCCGTPIKWTEGTEGKQV